MTDAPELKPCPFCGREAGFQAIQGDNPKPFAWDVIHSCAVGGGRGWIRISPRDVNGRGTQQLAADAWNTRAHLVPAMLAEERVAGQREGLEAAAAICADAANEAQDDNGCGSEAAAWLMAAARSIRALIGGADD